MDSVVTIKRNQIKDITDRLDAVIRLIALLLPKEIKQNDKITILYDLGFQPKEIASILGTTPNTVRVTLVKIRRSLLYKGQVEDTEKESKKQEGR